MFSSYHHPSRNGVGLQVSTPEPTLLSMSRESIDTDLQGWDLSLALSTPGKHTSHLQASHFRPRVLHLTNLKVSLSFSLW